MSTEEYRKKDLFFLGNFLLPPNLPLPPTKGWLDIDLMVKDYG
jgi:hypothetical protein